MLRQPYAPSSARRAGGPPDPPLPIPRPVPHISPLAPLTLLACLNNQSTQISAWYYSRRPARGWFYRLTGLISRGIRSTNCDFSIDLLHCFPLVAIFGSSYKKPVQACPNLMDLYVWHTKYHALLILNVQNDWVVGVLIFLFIPIVSITTNAWIKWLGCHGASRGQQVSHHRQIWGIRYAQAMKHKSDGIHPGFETQGRHH